MNKKKIVIITVLLVIAAAVKFRFALAYMILGDEPVQLDRSEISAVSATSVVSVPVRTVKLSEPQIDRFIEMINSLDLKSSQIKNTKKGGWLYTFSVVKKDGSTAQIAFLDNGLITVDGYDCFTLHAVSNALDEYFEGG